MSDINPFFSVTCIVFAVYLLMALLGSRERNEAARSQARRAGKTNAKPAPMTKHTTANR